MTKLQPAIQQHTFWPNLYIKRDIVIIRNFLDYLHFAYKGVKQNFQFETLETQTLSSKINRGVVGNLIKT